TGFLASAVPTARAARGRPICSATQAYGRASPNGIWRAASSTRRWKSGTLERSTDTPKNARSPRRYSGISFRAWSASRRAAAVTGASRRRARIRQTPRGVAGTARLRSSLWKSASDFRATATTRRVRLDGAASGRKKSIRSRSSGSGIFASGMPRPSLADLHAQERFAPRELALHGVDRDAPDARQLPIGESVHVAQGQQQARFARDALEGPVKIEIRARRPVVRGARRHRARSRALVVRRPRGAPAELVHADVGEDAVDPRGDSPSRVVAGRPGVALEESPLDGVLGVGSRAQQPSRHGEPTRAVSAGRGRHLDQTRARARRTHLTRRALVAGGVAAGVAEAALSSWAGRAAGARGRSNAVRPPGGSRLAV